MLVSKSNYNIYRNLFLIAPIHLFLLKGLLSDPSAIQEFSKEYIVEEDAHIARSLVNVDMINDMKDDVEDEESDEEYENDVVMEEIGDDSDQEEAADTGRKSETDEDLYHEGDNESDDDNHYEDDEDNDNDDDDVSDEDNDDEINVSSEEVQISDILCSTKSGRTCRTWKARYLYY